MMEKCDDSGPCKHLRQRLVESGAGFYKIEQVQRQEVVTIAVLYKTNTKDRGLMLNICPWCEAMLTQALIHHIEAAWEQATGLKVGAHDTAAMLPNAKLTGAARHEQE